MKLWLVERRYDLPDIKNPWNISYICLQASVVRAETENKARLLAADDFKAEGYWVWLNPEFTSCDEITVNDQPKTIINVCRGSA